MSETRSPEPHFAVSITPSGEASVSFSGSWRQKPALAALPKILARLKTSSTLKTLRLEGAAVSEWDSAFLAVLMALFDYGNKGDVEVSCAQIPAGAEKLLKLAHAVPERGGGKSEKKKENLVSLVGSLSLRLGKEFGAAIEFLGEVTLGVGRLLRGRARFQRRDVVMFIEDCGPRALPIVTLISTLVGLILAFIGAVQLSNFGAQVYVANLVGIAMAREMGAVMAGIILAGRTGAAFAAQLGTMQVNEEIDALKTLGIPPIDFLVLPRVLALSLMMPLLCLYADLLGILGGAAIGLWAMDISPALYWDQTIASVTITDFGIGIAKSVVFGILIALSGCLRGMQSGRSASAVGDAATSAVVTAIVLIVVTDAVFAIACNVLGI